MIRLDFNILKRLIEDLPTLRDIWNKECHKPVDDLNAKVATKTVNACVPLLTAGVGGVPDARRSLTSPPRTWRICPRRHREYEPGTGVRTFTPSLALEEVPGTGLRLQGVTGCEMPLRATGGWCLCVCVCVCVCVWTTPSRRADADSWSGPQQPGGTGSHQWHRDRAMADKHRASAV